MQAKLSEAENRPLLTIAIPTYNRSSLLSQLLDSLRDQIVGDPRVHVLISDNASTDDTVRVVEEERRRGTRLDYIRNTDNIGAERNFLQCYDQAATKYLWIISDDDLLCRGTVPRVLDYLSEDEYEIVFIAPGGFFGDRPIERPAGYPEKALVCTDSARFLRRVHVFTTLISSNIINKDRVEAIGHKPFSTLVGSGLVQLGWTYTALRGHRKSLYIGQKLVRYRLANTGGYELCRVFGANLMDITENWLGVPHLNKLIMNGTLQRFFPPFLVESKLSPGRYLQEDPSSLLGERFGHSFRYWFFAHPLLVLPGRLAWSWLQILRVVNRLDRALGYPSLGW